MKGRYTIGRRALAAGLLLTLGAVLTTAAAQAGSTRSLAFSGDAFGSLARAAGQSVRSDPTFDASLSACAAKRGDRSKNSGASTRVAHLIGTGTVSNAVGVSRSGLPAVTSMSTTQSASLLNGLVRARVVRAKSRVTYTGSAFRFGDGSRLVGLSVAGKAITAHANTRITLRNVGYVIVHERSRKVANGRALQVINMLHVFVTVAGNKYGLRPGANLIVGHAAAAVQARVPGGPVIGGAYGSHAQVGKTASAGYSAIISLPCLGGSVSNTTAGVSLLKAATTGTVVDTGASHVSSSGSNGTLSSITHNARLLKGLITASVVHAQISGSFNGTSHSFSDNSTFAGLSVRGVHVKARPNTVIKLGFARLYLHRRIQTARGLTVLMIQLQVTHANTFGLKTGTDIRVGVVHLGFRA